MENGWNLFTSSGRGQNSNCTNLAWDVWESRYDWSSSSNNHNTHNNHIAAAPVNTAVASEAHALTFSRGNHDPRHSACCSSPHPSVYDGSGSGQHYHPDPHLMCLKLGKRHYFEDPSGRPGFSVSKRGKAYYAGGELAGPSTAAAVARCQVEGCHVALVSAKEYHRRHKVCEMHSKAPKVVVLGLDQRFCQQCSRLAIALYPPQPLPAHFSKTLWRGLSSLHYLASIIFFFMIIILSDRCSTVFMNCTIYIKNNKFL